jgi:hypothetical protein
VRCKPGDLAVVVSVDNHPALPHLIGRMLTVTKPEQAWDGPAWRYKGKRLRAAGQVCDAVPDRWLRPLRPGEGTDETLTWCPHGQSVPA